MTTITVEYVAELFVRPRNGGAPVSHGTRIVRHELSTNQQKVMQGV